MSKINVIRLTKRLDKSTFCTVRFAIKARAEKDKYVNPMMYVRVCGGSVYATDGHRLHMTNSLNGYMVEDGVYEVVKENSQELILLGTGTTDFPDYQAVIDSTASKSKKVHLSGETDADIVKINRAMSCDEGVSYTFIEQISGFCQVAMIPDGKGKPIHFIGEEHGHVEAYIMPFSMV